MKRELTVLVRGKKKQENYCNQAGKKDFSFIFMHLPSICGWKKESIQKKRKKGKGKGERGKEIHVANKEWNSAGIS